MNDSGSNAVRQPSVAVLPPAASPRRVPTEQRGDGECRARSSDRAFHRLRHPHAEGRLGRKGAGFPGADVSRRAVCGVESRRRKECPRPDARSNPAQSKAQIARTPHPALARPFSSGSVSQAETGQVLPTNGVLSSRTPSAEHAVGHNQRSADMLRQLIYPLLPYRSFAFPILVLSLIVVPCWFVFRLYRHRTRGHPLSFHREILLLTFVLYLAGLAAVTLTPSRSSRARVEATEGIEIHPNLASLTCSSAIPPRGSTARAFCVRNARGNVLLFFPLGILIPLVWRHLRFWRVMQIAIAVSCSIELVQYLSRAWGSKRLADVNDVVLNVLGACLGLALVSLLRLRQGTRPAVLRA